MIRYARLVLIGAALCFLPAVLAAKPTLTGQPKGPPKRPTAEESSVEWPRTDMVLWHKGDSLSLWNQDSYVDSTLLVTTGKDTSAWYSITGCRAIGSIFYLSSYDDSARVTVTAQVTADTGLATQYFHTLAASWSMGYSDVSNGSDDTVQAFVHYATSVVDTAGAGTWEPDRPLIESMRFMRFIATAAIPSTDTIVVRQMLNRVGPVQAGKSW